MRWIRTMLLAILCFSGLAVAQKLACQFDRGIDFSRFKIYQWVTVADNSVPNRITAQNIVNLINTDIAERVSPWLLLTTLQTFTWPTRCRRTSKNNSIGLMTRDRGWEVSDRPLPRPSTRERWWSTLTTRSKST
jgi:hypothetical protein